MKPRLEHLVRTVLLLLTTWLPLHASATDPTITTPPTNQTVIAGGITLLNVTASGTEPFAYQWLKGGLAVDAATNSTCAITNVQASHAGSYSVVVSNVVGSVTSSVATVSVIMPPALAGPPRITTVYFGLPTRFTNTFVGNVLQGTLIVPLIAGTNFVASKVPQAGLVATELGLPVLAGDLVRKFDPATGGFDTFSYGAGGWTPTEPAIGVGEGFVLVTGTPRTWIRIFSVSQ